jgi:hypothetical protein
LPFFKRLIGWFPVSASAERLASQLIIPQLFVRSAE